MDRDDDSFRSFRKWMYDMLEEFSKGRADYIRINEILDNIKPDLQGKMTFGGVVIDDDGNISYSGSMPPEEFMEVLSKFPEFAGKGILNHIKKFYQQGKRSLILNDTLEVIEDDGVYRVVAELGPLYSPDCKPSIRGGYGTLSLEFKCKDQQPEVVIDIRKKFEEYYDGKLDVLEYHVSNNILEVLVKKV
jgi:hypothetical protein